MSDTQRIIELPEHDPTPDELATLVRKWTDRFRAPGGTWDLHPHQALALEYASQGLGGVFPMTVGSGKTLTGALLPAACGIAGSDAVLLCPPVLVTEAEAELEIYREHFVIDPPQYLAYSRLSLAENQDIFDHLAPKLVIADEAHALKNAKAARTRRFLRYMVGRLKAGDPVRFFGMSATFSVNAVKEFAHLAALALGEGSPLPTHYMTLCAWGRVLDAFNEEPPTPQDYRLLAPLVAKYAPDEPEQTAFRTRGQLAFGRRLRCTPGVVVTDLDASTAIIELRPWRADLTQPIVDAMAEVERSATLPDGGIVEDVPQKLNQLAQGFYYYHDWGPGGPDIAWLQARRWYTQELEEFQGRGRKGYDSRLLIERAMERNDPKVPPGLYRAKQAWDLQRHKPEPPRAVEWIDDSPLQQAVEHALKLPNCLVWSSYGAVHDRLEALGLPVARPGQRPGPEQHQGVAVWSHATGLNLQAWSHNLVIDPPASAGLWQQLLGRTDRYGQKAEVVEVWVNQTTSAQRKRLTGARAKARYIERTQGLAQKLVHATWRTT